VASQTANGNVGHNDTFGEREHARGLADEIVPIGFSSALLVPSAPGRAERKVGKPLSGLGESGGSLYLPPEESSGSTGNWLANTHSGS
jgi:hypothetical protein